MTTLKDTPPFSITSIVGKKNYYDHLTNYKEFGNSLPVRRMIPTIQQAEEFKDLLKEDRQGKRWEEINGWRLLEKYTRFYDWRDIVIGPEGERGLKSPDGTILLPQIFQNVLGQTMSIKYGMEPVPVFNGKGFGLIYPCENPVMLTPFVYKDVILERWEHEFYFVQSKETGKWGALKFGFEYSCFNEHFAPRRNKRVKELKEFLPMEFDEIYEDEILTDCSPTLFWVFRKKDKLGILTPYHHTEAVYDGYETDFENCSFILYRNGKKTVVNYHGA